MGVGGTVEYFTEMLDRCSRTNKLEQYQTVDLHCKIDCKGCERKVRKALNSIDGVHSVNIDRKFQKVSVTGYVEPEEVLKAAKRTGKRVQLWNFVPYQLVPEPYNAKLYDKKAPIGFVRKPGPSEEKNNKNDEAYFTMFNDDNTDSCSIM